VQLSLRCACVAVLCCQAAHLTDMCCVLQNDHKRFETYKACAIRLKYDSREPLPLCVVATIRAIFPEVDGIYVGYKAS
jgi:hypothetical protein